MTLSSLGNSSFILAAGLRKATVGSIMAILLYIVTFIPFIVLILSEVGLATWIKVLAVSLPFLLLFREKNPKNFNSHFCAVRLCSASRCKRKEFYIIADGPEFQLFDLFVFSPSRWLTFRRHNVTCEIALFPSSVVFSQNFVMSTSFSYGALYLTRYEQQAIGLHWNNVWHSPMGDED